MRNPFRPIAVLFALFLVAGCRSSDDTATDETTDGTAVPATTVAQ